MTTTVVGHSRPPRGGDAESIADHDAVGRYAANRARRRRHASLSWLPDLPDSPAYLVDDAGAQLFVVDGPVAPARTRT